MTMEKSREGKESAEGDKGVRQIPKKEGKGYAIFLEDRSKYSINPLKRAFW